MKTVTQKLLDQLNARRGRKYPDIGFLFYADVRGDGIPHKRIYEIINGQGGVSYSTFNAASAREQCDKIRAELQKS